MAETLTIHLSFAMHYRQYAPADLLRNLVRYYWSLDGRQFSISRLSILSFGDRYPRLIFQDVDCFEPIINDETGEEMPLCYLKGVRRDRLRSLCMAFSHFGCKLLSARKTYHFFRKGVDELTNQNARHQHGFTGVILLSD